MKLTLWQQFSSNHSNGFTVVGVFEDEAQAKKTVNRLRKLIRDIDAWYEENGEDKYESWSPSEPEIAIGKEFRFNWDDKTPEAPTDFDHYAFRQFRNFIAIESGADSWTRRAPYEILLRRLGAKVAGYDNVEEDGDAAQTCFRTKITATLPTEAAAASFAKKWRQKIEARGGTLKVKGTQISTAKLIFDLDLFSGIVKALDKAGSTDLDYQLKRGAMDQELI